MGLIKVNKLRFYPDKIEVMLVGPDLALKSGSTEMLDGIALPQKHHIHSLVDLFDLVLFPSNHVVFAARSTFDQIRLVHQL